MLLELVKLTRQIPTELTRRQPRPEGEPKIIQQSGRETFLSD